MDQTERIDEHDSRMMANARAEVRAAQGIVDFCFDQIATKYKFQPGDRLEPDGTIVRKPAAPDGGDQ